MTTLPLTIGALVRQAAHRWPDRAALRFGDREAGHAAFLAETETCARALIANGIGRGDRVGLFLPNGWACVILMHALGMIGAAAVTLNARLRMSDLQFAIRKARLKALFSAEAPPFDGLARVSQALSDGMDLPVFDAVLASGQSVARTDLETKAALVEPGDDWLIMFSSGTTADPKACRLSHRAVILSAAGMADRFGIGSSDRFWDPLPLFHMSTILPMTACRLHGACFIGVAHFEAGPALAEIEATGATIAYPAFPTLMAGLISHPDFVCRDLSAVRLTLAVGPPDLLRRFQAAWPDARQVSCYGLTEAGGLSCYNRPEDSVDQRMTTSGRPIRGMSARITDPGSGQIIGPGAQGEIQLTGDTLFSGYFDDPDQTAAAMTPDGWLKTGDIGRMSVAGDVTYVGRIKDMLRVGGENVAAAEIEGFLATHPAIKLAQVIGVPDPVLEEVPVAFIELAPGMALSDEEVVGYCRDQIARFKVPRHVRFVDEWPMSATKIQKFRLREDFLAEAARPRHDVGS
ncbi:class I adenylate-forming enzyme family protein [Mesobacterium pallidum]|uniref:class I adenylate-forming enzyme family protein n=1 Tax=Mesobacterium pallidum TaxID=2872037 RepID=UPI001EE2CDC3|nr:AMP-binding protein [Mesobacterium pallidum]